MAQNFGIVVTEHSQKKLAPAKPVELWEPEEGQIRIRIEAAAQNPVDWKQLYTDFLGIPSFPYVLGVDAAGVVDKVGPGVTHVNVGDRVAALSLPATHAKFGVYQRYNIAIADAAARVPSSITFDEAATFPVAYWTAALGLHSLLQIPIPLDESKQITPKVAKGEPLLVWGGSSSVGALAVQLGVISGFKVIATASPRNFEYVKSLGADEVLDYHDPNIVEKIRKLAPNLRYAYDAISDFSEHGSTASIFASFSAPSPEVVISFGTVPNPPEDVKVHYVFAAVIYFPGHQEEKESLTELWEILMREGKLKPHPIKLMPNGLNSIDEGFDLMRQDKVSGQKLVYRPGETKI